MDRRDVLAGGIGLAFAATVAGRASAAAPGDSMITRKIPSTGEAVPVVGLGTSGPFEVGTAPAERAPIAQVLEAFFEGGGRLIDTSPMYSTAETVLGDLLSPAMHERTFMATKVWTRGERAGVEQMTRSGELTKRKRLDLIQVHNLLDLETHLRTLRRWKDEGSVRYIGITHYTVGAHADLARVIEREKLDFVQLNYSAATRDAEARLLPLARDKGVAVIVNRPFEDGRLFEGTRGKPVPAWASDFDSASWAQLFLKYVIAHPAVTCVIPATGKVKNVRDNLEAGRGRLPDAKQRAQIMAAVNGL
ncbi:MAG: aldo/keto reductase [Steroidobacteraceae bacterium]